MPTSTHTLLPITLATYLAVSSGPRSDGGAASKGSAARTTWLLGHNPPSRQQHNAAASHQLLRPLPRIDLRRVEISKSRGEQLRVGGGGGKGARAVVESVAQGERGSLPLVRRHLSLCGQRKHLPCTPCPISPSPLPPPTWPKT